MVPLGVGKAFLTKLNPDAEIIPVERGQVSLDKVPNTGKFNFQAPGWLKEMRGRTCQKQKNMASAVFLTMRAACSTWKKFITFFPSRR